MNFDNNLWILLGILLFICVWFFGLWKASTFLHKRVRPKVPTTPRPQKPPTNWPIYQILFYFGHGVLLISLTVRLFVEPTYYYIAGMLFMLGELVVMGAYIYCNFHTEIEPSLIDLTFKHELNTRQRYEDVVLQTRANWLYENPTLIWIGLVFIMVGSLVTLISQNWVHIALIAGFGLHLILYVHAFGKISVLTFRKNNVSLQRWLSTHDAVYMPYLEITNIKVMQTTFQRLLNVHTLVLESDHLTDIVIVIKEAPKLKRLIEDLMHPEDADLPD